MKCNFCGRELKYDFEIKVGICEACMMKNEKMKNIKSYNEFKSINEEGIFKNKLPDFEMTAKVKKIVIDINGEKVKALAGGWSGKEVSNSKERDTSTFYFKTDIANTNILKRHGIRSVYMIDSDNNIIVFNDNFNDKIAFQFKINFLSKRDIGEYWDEVEDGEYLAWNISGDYDDGL